ncbi:ATP-binding protein [Streptacidiphilus jiangxiensis]|uniref:Histidine kinase/HSP90-like ATPase domain-containing protein n=1 Tax=Streptacidiphilus jiangxiensis TaxID=235985 RepID=A0A1H7HC80_STRJI|nr:ATP-binding protein [Streptacidiphilus jiangxiensis]SEK45755.1 hypothetical protein SAMN05414137_10291 [Streptacidiphilus jiangxiensis]
MPEIRRLALGGFTNEVAAGRGFTRAALTDWGWTDTNQHLSGRPEATDDVLLVVSELLSNASRHAGGTLVLEARRLTARSVRVEVFDRSSTLPTPSSPDYAGQTGGYGLRIVHRLSTRWGVTLRRASPGKSVWAELSR